MAADSLFENMGKSNTERRELMHQMKKYRVREKPFDIELSTIETPHTWWFSLEDSFPKGEDYLVQLALKLFSITPHAAGCERVWSSLGWIYGKRRNRLGLNKIEKMYKLSAYYHAALKKELPYYGVGKSTEEIREILIDAHLNPDEDLLELEDDSPDNNSSTEVGVISEEGELIINNIVNLDALTNTLGELIEDSLEIRIPRNNEAGNSMDCTTVDNDIVWDPDAEADGIINNM